jgi:hypothetical protein
MREARKRITGGLMEYVFGKMDKGRYEGMEQMRGLREQG